MAAFDVSNKIMTALSANGLTALIGNWVRSRAKGIIDGFDYGICGEIDKIHIESLNTVLENAGLKNPEKIQNYGVMYKNHG